MRITMIHALPESVPPTRSAFQEMFPEAELVNFLDEGLFIDFQDHLTAKLRRRMCQVVCYCAEHGADAIGLACSVYTPVVEMASAIEYLQKFIAYLGCAPLRLGKVQLPNITALVGIYFDK